MTVTMSMWRPRRRKTSAQADRAPTPAQQAPFPLHIPPDAAALRANLVSGEGPKAYAAAAVGGIAHPAR